MNKLLIAMFAIVTFAQITANTEELTTTIKKEEVEVVAPVVTTEEVVAPVEA